jgi:hypothetical protein
MKGAPMARRMAPTKSGGGNLDSLGSLGEGVSAPHAADLAPQPSFAPPPPPAAAPGTQSVGQLSPQAASQAQAAEKDESAFGAAQRQYRDGDYPGATQSFDGLAAGGDQKAALWAARSSRDGAGGCPSAVSRFDGIAASSFGTENGYDATLEAAECYRRMGQVDAARSRYQRLLTVPQYAARAQAGINGISVVAAKRAKPMAITARPAAAPAPSAAPTTPTAK